MRGLKRRGGEGWGIRQGNLGKWHDRRGLGGARLGLSLFYDRVCLGIAPNISALVAWC